ncbi:sensor histidine kinase [Amycolatopsis sp. CA-230715]|uniref:sensor histidine kinase n=1 Tax=Amycolatopsis sp. CA-230715 TaxID=2745196 RepID=UPI001C03A06C|nr:histidine kinase [Amycolatopsis sp. CA-230715]QWF85957.1 hypothetical protein HUW46_09438 [Amycolatopsis sp. CA-230715]
MDRRGAAARPRFWRRRGLWCTVAAVFFLGPASVGPAGVVPAAVSALVAVCVAIWRWPSGRVGFPAAVAACSAVSLLVDTCYVDTPTMAVLWLPFELAALLVLLGRVIRVVPSNRVVAVATLAGLTALALPLRFTARNPSVEWDDSVILLALVVFPLAYAIGVGAYLRSLDARRVNAVSDARREQRLEVARDLHDFVAHEVTGIVVEVQAAQFAQYDEREARALFARVEEAGLRALESMDRTLQALRDPASAQDARPARLYGVGDLPELVDRFAANAAARVEFAMDEAAPGRLDREADATAYTLVLEALTNVRRHAPAATKVAVSVAFADGPALELSVVDDGGGRGPKLARTGGGTGLAGLRDRFETLGGTLCTGPVRTGWGVRGSLPVPEQPGNRGRRLSG